MNWNRGYFYLVLSNSLFFGWLLSFPFYGPVLLSAAPPYQGILSLPFLFTLSHALSFILGALLLKNTKIWKPLMAGSLTATIAVNTILPFVPPALWSWAMVLLGLLAAIFLFGWIYPYTMFVPMAGRLKFMASVIIGANIVLVIFNLLTNTISSALVLFLSGVPLWLAFPAVLLLQPEGRSTSRLGSPVQQQGPSIVPLMLIFCLFIAGLYLCSGFMYNLMQPTLSAATPFSTYSMYLSYITVLLVMWRYGSRLRWYFPVYMGVSLLGLAFVSFALVYHNTPGLFLTTSLIEAAYAFLDLFIWTVLADLAFLYGAPFQFFGFALAAMLFSILMGELIGAQLLEIGEHYRFVTALFAAAAIFLTFIVIPWLNERIQMDFPWSLKKGEKEQRSGEQDPLEIAKELLLSGEHLTPRETEITVLLLKGLGNKEIAEQLFISENTLKTHLRNIYWKFGVGKKRELLSLVVDKRNKRNTSET